MTVLTRWAARAGFLLAATLLGTLAFLLPGHAEASHVVRWTTESASAGASFFDGSTGYFVGVSQFHDSRFPPSAFANAFVSNAAGQCSGSGDVGSLGGTASFDREAGTASLEITIPLTGDCGIASATVDLDWASGDLQSTTRSHQRGSNFQCHTVSESFSALTSGDPGLGMTPANQSFASMGFGDSRCHSRSFSH